MFMYIYIYMSILFTYLFCYPLHASQACPPPAPSDHPPLLFPLGHVQRPVVVYVPPVPLVVVGVHRDPWTPTLPRWIVCPRGDPAPRSDEIPTRPLVMMCCEASQRDVSGMPYPSIASPPRQGVLEHGYTACHITVQAHKIGHRKESTPVDDGLDC